MEIVLASASPRRAELLRQIGVSFQVRPSNIREGKPYRPLIKWVQDLAKEKALAVPGRPGEIILGADTIVVHKQEVLGKPKDEAEAKAMLQCLSGNSHEVLTGICLVCYDEGADSGPRIYQDVEITQVTFRRLSPVEIEHYVASGEPLDKAGAYGIQGLGALLVESVYGCYYNVVGLPLVKTARLLRKCGVPVMGET